MANTFLLPHVFESEIAVRTDVLGSLPANVPPNSFPTAIRWRIHPNLGFPREPFKVFRRSNGLLVDRTPLTLSPSGVAGSAVMEWGRIPLIELRCNAVPSPGSSLTLQALDDRGKPILGERVVVTATIQVRLRTPGICALQVFGSGNILNAVGFKMTDLANDSHWELIETVGLPVTSGQVQNVIYNTGLQGHPGALESGLEAAKDRLNIALALYRPPPATDPSGGAAPAWPAPPLAQILSEVRDGPNSPLSMILEMLGKVDPVSIDLTQAKFEKEFKGTGLRQPGGLPPADSASNKVKLASMVLLSAAVDGWTALALGFGTTDFPTQKTDPISGVAVAPQAFSPAFDYMVTADYILPLGFKLTVGTRVAAAVPHPAARSVLRKRSPAPSSAQD